MIETVTRVLAAGRHGQDRAEVIRHAGGVVVVVADGAGGTSGARDAADAVVMWTKALVTRGADLADVTTWSQLLIDLDYQLGSAASGQTTAVIANVTSGGIIGASVGDSAAWLIGPDGCDNLTARQSRKPLIGSGHARPQPFAAAFKGALLIATDGLINYAKRNRVCAVASQADLGAAVTQLVDLVRLRSGQLPDDVALVLCRVAVTDRPPD